MLTHAAQSISEWLTSLGMQQYVGAFADNAIDANALDALDHELLKEIVDAHDAEAPSVHPELLNVQVAA